MFKLIVVGLAFAAASFAVAFFIPWLPESASRERRGIDFVFWFTTVICIAIFALVVAVILYSVVKFRARPGDDSDGAPIHGHTGLEILWTAVPAVLVTAISIASAVVLARNERMSDDDMRVEVSGQQFAWSFKYLDHANLVSGQLRLPVDRRVVLKITARDVIHSFWVPEFGQKLDALPDQSNDLPVTPTKVGTYPVICTELCGLGHATMRSFAIVMPQDRFDAWIRAEKEKMRQPDGQAGEAVYRNNGCGSCHTLQQAGSTGKVGPDLDKLPQQARRARKPLEEFVRESIVNPNAYVEPGYARGVMPPYDQLPEQQLDALVEFLVDASRGGS